MTDLVYKRKIGHPGESIEYVLRERGVSLESFADETGIHLDDVTALVNCEISITEEFAEVIGEWFGTSSGMWMNMQRGYEAGTVIEVPIIGAEEDEVEYEPSDVFHSGKFQDVYESRRNK